MELYAVLADSVRALLRVGKTTLDSDRFPSLTPDCPQVHLFEREIAEQYGVRPEGHPWFKPVRFHASYRPGHDAWGRTAGRSARSSASPTSTASKARRSTRWRSVRSTPASSSRGISASSATARRSSTWRSRSATSIAASSGRWSAGRTSARSTRMETVAGDTSIGHATAYCQAVEALAGCQVPIRAEVLRGIALELERLANHTGDLGALAGDVGFLPTASYCGRIRGDFLNLTALLCGSRFGRGLVRPGGVGFDLDASRKRAVSGAAGGGLPRRGQRGRPALELGLGAGPVRGTGAGRRDVCLALGLVGPAARACGLESRRAPGFPCRHLPLRPDAGFHLDNRRRLRPRLRPLAGDPALGGVHPRASSRRSRPGRSARRRRAPLKPEHLVVSLVEGWRGEICHVALTDAQGRFARYKIVDPSFHNWTGLALALRDQQISDFPLCNKSFNLSYCGHDL